MAAMKTDYDIISAMKNNLKIKVLAVGLLAAGLLQAAPLRFVTFNIWGDYFGNPVQERVDGVAQVLERQQPDVISLQEVTPRWWKSGLFERLGKLGYVTLRGDETNALLRAGATRNVKKWSPRFVNHEPLVFNGKRLKLLDQGLEFFHLHLQPEKSVTWAVLEDRTDGRRFLAFATHFWWQTNGAESDMLREFNARRILAIAEEVRKKWGATLPVIGGGDLNTYPGTWALQAFAAAGWSNAATSAAQRSPVSSHHGNPVRGEDGRYHGKQREPNNNARFAIDHVFYTPGIKGLRQDIDLSQTALDVSDHSPVVVDFEVK